MQNFLTALIEVFSVASFLFFATAFIVGFVERDRELHPVTTIPDVNIDMDEVMAGYEAHHRLVIEDTVIPFTRPYRKPICEPINWAQWGIRDLRRASQRAAFGVPVEVNRGRHRFV